MTAPRAPVRARGVPVALAVALALAGCTRDTDSTSAAESCASPRVSEGVVEVPAAGGSVTGLLFGELPAEVGADLKIVWRVTGEGQLAVRSLRPDGSAGAMVFGPEPHSGSNFEAPGAEWGTGFRFDVPGCWRIELSRGGVTAELALPVVEG